MVKPSARVGGSKIELVQPLKVMSVPMPMTRFNGSLIFSVPVMGSPEPLPRLSLLLSVEIVKGGQGYVGTTKRILYSAQSPTWFKG